MSASYPGSLNVDLAKTCLQYPDMCCENSLANDGLTSVRRLLLDGGVETLLTL